MSGDEDVQRILRQGALEHVDAQLDGTTNIVKLPISVVSCLDLNGRQALNARVSERVGKETEIFLDSRTFYRVMIGALGDIRRAWPCEPREVHDSMRVLYATIPHEPVPVGRDGAANLPGPDVAPRPKKKARGPANAFILFRSHWSPIVKREQPDVDNSTISKQLGDRWRELPAGEKAEWYQRAKEHKEEFLKQKEEEEKRKQDRQLELQNRGPKRRRRNGSQTATTPSEAPTPTLQPLEPLYANTLPAPMAEQPPIFGGLPTPLEQPAAVDAAPTPAGGDEFNFGAPLVPAGEQYTFHGTAGLGQFPEDDYVPYYEEPIGGIITEPAPANEVVAQEATSNDEYSMIDTAEEYLDWLNE